MGTSTERSARSSTPTPSWRLQRWPTDATVGHLVVRDHQLPLERRQIETALVASRRQGHRALRTSALFPAAAEMFASAGFEPIDRLALLRVDLPIDPALRRELGASSDAAIVPLRPWARRATAAVDRAAFGPVWGNSSSSLRDTMRATPAHRARIVRIDRSVVACAISGAAGSTGYVQRVAVDPDHRRRGLARRLVLDGLDWMTTTGVTNALVNTGVGNEPALALYHALGFELLDEELIIAERRWS